VLDTPPGVPQQDYVVLLGLLRRKLTDHEVHEIAKELADLADTGTPITTADVEKLINDATLDTASEQERRPGVGPAGGRRWPLAGRPAGLEEPPLSRRRRARKWARRLFSGWTGIRSRWSCGWPGPVLPERSWAPAAPASQRCRRVDAERALISNPAGSRSPCCPASPAVALFDALGRPPGAASRWAISMVEATMIRVRSSAQQPVGKTAVDLQVGRNRQIVR